jgi:aminopeptidase N
MQSIIELERARQTQPLALRSEAYSDFNTYNAMTYTKPALVLRMLRELVGEDVTRRALKDYYQKNRFRHVTEADLRSAFERASGQNLGWFFQEWFHTTGQLDYEIAAVSTSQQADGTWRTRIEVRRNGENFMPVVLAAGSATRRLDSRERVQVVTVETNLRPAEVVLDPQNVLIDVQPANNRKRIP